MAIPLEVIPYKPSPGNEKPGYYGPPTPGTETAPFPAPGVPKPSTTTTSGTGSSPGNGTPTPEQSSRGPTPQVVANDTIISRLLKPALTSHFQCIFNPPDVPEIRQYYFDGQSGNVITLLCSEASLPGSSILTNEINDDYTGITERIGYRRQYDDRADFTFYVDHGTVNGGYNAIKLFEAWIRYAMGETSYAPDANYSYRVRFPDGPKEQTGGPGYRNEIFIQKFERDLKFGGNYLEYVFVKAYPISITSMPVSYETSSLLKCTVSFTYNRYILRGLANKLESEPAPPTPAPGIPQDTQFGVDTTGQFGQTGSNLNQNPFTLTRTGPFF